MLRGQWAGAHHEDHGEHGDDAFDPHASERGVGDPRTGESMYSQTSSGHFGGSGVAAAGAAAEPEVRYRSHSGSKTSQAKSSSSVVDETDGGGGSGHHRDAGERKRAPSEGSDTHPDDRDTADDTIVAAHAGSPADALVHLGRPRQAATASRGGTRVAPTSGGSNRGVVTPGSLRDMDRHAAAHPQHIVPGAHEELSASMAKFQMNFSGRTLQKPPMLGAFKPGGAYGVGGDDGGTGDADTQVSAAKAVAARYSSYNTSIRCTLDPVSHGMERWDALMMLLLGYTCIWTPFELVFLDVEAWSELFWFNRVVDILFFTDLVMQFFIRVRDPLTHKMLTSHRDIARRYLCSGMIFVDAVSVFPWELLGVAAGSDELADLQGLRILRLLRLVKLLRVVKASRIIKRWEDMLGVPFASLMLIRYIVLSLVTAHWVACAWRLAATLGELEGDGNESWLTVVAASYDDRGDSADGGDGGTDLLQSPTSVYAVTLYWAVMTISSIGTGDIIPRTLAERVMAIVCMGIGGTVYVYVIGSVCSIVASMDRATNHYRETMDHLHAYMDEMRLPADKRQLLLAYFQHIRERTRLSHFQDLLTQMSPQLRGFLALRMHEGWITRVSFLEESPADEKEKLVTALALALRSRTYVPGEAVITPGEETTQMFVINRGLAGSPGRIIRAGDYCGDDIILSLSRRRYRVNALSFLDVSVLHRKALKRILWEGDFLVTRKAIRRQAVRLAFRREVRMMAALKRRADLALKRSLRLARLNERARDAATAYARSGSGSSEGDDDISLTMVDMTRLLRDKDGNPLKKIVINQTNVMSAVSDRVVRLQPVAKSLFGQGGVGSGLRAKGRRTLLGFRRIDTAVRLRARDARATRATSATQPRKEPLARVAEAEDPATSPREPGRQLASPISGPPLTPAASVHSLEGAPPLVAMVSASSGAISDADIGATSVATIGSSKLDGAHGTVKSGGAPDTAATAATAASDSDGKPRASVAADMAASGASGARTAKSKAGELPPLDARTSPVVVPTPVVPTSGLSGSGGALSGGGSSGTTAALLLADFAQSAPTLHARERRFSAAGRRGSVSLTAGDVLTQVLAEVRALAKTVGEINERVSAIDAAVANFGSE